VTPARVTAEVVLPKATFQTEPVSRRLLRSLPHPDRKASLPLLAFNPDGQLVVCGYPSGVVQVLDPASGKELLTLETPRGYRGTFNYVQVSQDRRTLFVALDDSKFEPMHQGEKKTFFRRYNGETRIYDLRTGAQKEPLKTEPRRGVVDLAVSPDATRVATMELTSGPTEDFAKLRAIYLWDVATRRAVKLRDGYGYLRFSPDGRRVWVTANDDTSKTTTIYAYSATTGKEAARLQIPDGRSPGFAFSPDGKRAALPTVDAQAKRPIVRLYDPTMLQPQGDLGAEEVKGASRFGQVMFSPDGRSLAAVSGKAVYLWDVTTQRLTRSWALQTPGRVWSMTFDATGRRLAASTWFVPPELQNARDEVVTPQDYPQPRIHLIDVAADRPEEIVCPHGWWGRPAFSPDGKLLAVGGAGATHVFDVSARQAAR
jgi:WD40 repeat protein